MLVRPCAEESIGEDGAAGLRRKYARLECGFVDGDVKASPFSWTRLAWPSKKVLGSDLPWRYVSYLEQLEGRSFLSLPLTTKVLIHFTSDTSSRASHLYPVGQFVQSHATPSRTPAAGALVENKNTY